MPYVPNPVNAAEPLDSEAAGTAAAEFRALKGRVNTLAGTLASNARNKIINGKMEIAQRGTSFPAVGAGTYTLDRWRTSSNATTAVLTASQQSDVPSSSEFQNSLRLAVTTLDTSIASTDQFNIQQRIEGYNARDLIGKTFALSFWVRSTKTGTHCVYFQNSGQDRTFVIEYTVSASNTWEYKTVTVSGGLITAGTWDWTTGVGLVVGWTLAAGSSLQTTAGAWQTGTFLATSNQVNCLDSTSNIFALTGVQLEVGGVATPFEHRPYGAELALCQRYFFKTYPQDVSPGSVSSGTPPARITDATQNYASIQVFFPVSMRATPTVVVYNPVTGATASMRGDTANFAAVTAGIGPGQATVYANNVSIGTSILISAHITAAIEL